MGVPPMITGTVAGSDEGLDTFELRYAQGRPLTADDEGALVTVLGSDIARKYAVNVGDTIKLHGVAFEVVGILEPTLTAPDQAASVPMQAAQELFIKTLPPMVRDRLDVGDLVTTMTVYPVAGTDPELLADRIELIVPNVSVMTGKDFDEQIGSATSILNAILVGIALISLAVGGLSVINTMAMSIAAGDRRQPVPDRAGARDGVGADRVHRRDDRPDPWGRRRHPGQRGGPLLRDRPVRVDRLERRDGRAVRHGARGTRRLRPGPSRGPARSGHRPSL
jgi:hypothetical protein